MTELTPEELGRIASEHVYSDYDGPMGGMKNGSCEVCECDWPCDAARLYALVLKQSALMDEWGLPGSCHPDFDLE